MPLEKTITDLMIEEHFLLERLLNKLEEALKEEYKTSVDLLGEFKREFSRHIATEEDAVFKFFNPREESDYYDVVPKLVKEHNTILEMLNDTENRLATADIAEISEGYSNFKKLLLAHKEFEEKEFYPEMDRNLNAVQKEEVREKIHASFPGLSDQY
jgi:hemerythrin-like domain-containing protein